MNNHDWMQRDLRHVWHPCTQMQEHETLPLVPIQRGEGVWLHDFDGNRFLDAVSSWWVNLFGHANPRINAALKDQLDALEHVILAGFTHAPIVELSERLVALAPPEGADLVPPGDETELAMVRIWEDVLERSPVSVEDDFFELGGDSLHAAALFARIAREFGSDLPVAALVSAPTVRRLASLVRSGVIGFLARLRQEVALNRRLFGGPPITERER